MEKKININICKQFSPDPWGRYDTDNPISSGEKFRKQFLVNAFTHYDVVYIDFSNLPNIPDSSFIGEAFVGLVKHDNFTYDEILKKLVILPENDPIRQDFYPNYVKRIINLARNENLII